MALLDTFLEIFLSFQLLFSCLEMTLSCSQLACPKALCMRERFIDPGLVPYVSSSEKKGFGW